MKVIVTLDRYDGAKSQAKEMSLEGTSLNSLVFQLMSGDVCGCTITKLPRLTKLVKKMEEAK